MSEEKQYKYPWMKILDKRIRTPKKVDNRPRNKQEREEAIHAVLKKDYLLDHPICECGRPGCTRLAVDVHHKKGRGKWLNVVEFFLAVCRHCHDWIEANPSEAKRLGYSVNRIERKGK